MKDSDVTRIVENLKEAGFDGLYCPEEPCGCAIDDLAPCGEDEFLQICQPAHAIPCRPDLCGASGCEGEEGTTCYSPFTEADALAYWKAMKERDAL